MLNLYFDALNLVPSTQVFLSSLVLFMFTLIGAGLGGALSIPAFEALGRLLARRKVDKLAQDGPFQVPAYMAEWPTWEEITRTEDEWNELVLEAVEEQSMSYTDFTSDIVAKAMAKGEVDSMDFWPETVDTDDGWENEDYYESELDELWDRLFSEFPNQTIKSIY